MASRVVRIWNDKDGGERNADSPGDAPNCVIVLMTMSEMPVYCSRIVRVQQAYVARDRSLQCRETRRRRCKYYVQLSVVPSVCTNEASARGKQQQRRWHCYVRDQDNMPGTDQGSWKEFNVNNVVTGNHDIMRV